MNAHQHASAAITARCAAKTMPLLTGRGRFTDDLNAPDQAYAAVSCARTVGHATHPTRRRERRAHHARRASASSPDADLAADGLGGIPPVASTAGRDGKPMVAAAMPVLANDRIRYVGEPVAIVVADTLAQAQDAAEQVADRHRGACAAPPTSSARSAEGAAALSRRKRPAISRSTGATAMPRPSTPPSRKPRMSSACGWRTRGLRRSRWSPVQASACGTRRRQRYTLIASTQGVAVVRKLLAEGVFKVPLSSIRVLTHDVGGGFGMKAQTYPEYAAILYAARKIGRPVKWCNSRIESFLSDSHGRDGILEGEMAFDVNGQNPGAARAQSCRHRRLHHAIRRDFRNRQHQELPVQRLPHSRDRDRRQDGVHQRGPARSLSRCRAAGGDLPDRAADRRCRAQDRDRPGRAAPPQFHSAQRNAIPDTPNGPIYDSGEFEAIMDGRWQLSDWSGFAKRRAASRKAGKLRGIGMCCFLEVAGGILNEKADLRFEADGTVAIRLGVQAMGQGHLSTLPRDRREAARHRYKQGQADRGRQRRGTGRHAFGRIALVDDGGQRLCRGLRRGNREGAPAGVALLEVAATDVEFAEGTFSVAGTDLSMPILELAKRVRATPDLPEDLKAGSTRSPSSLRRRCRFPTAATSAKSRSIRRHGVVVGGRLCRGGRCRHHHPRDHCRRPDPWRHCAGSRPGAGRAGPLWRGRATAQCFVHGLRDAARRRDADA